MPALFIILIPLLASIISVSVKKSTKTLNTAAISASLAELASALYIAASVAKNGAYSFTPYISVDSLGSILLLIVAAVGAAASWYSTGYLRAEVSKEIIGFRRVRQYFSLLHLFLFAMFFAIMTTNPILMWISIEATTLSTAFLISFYNKPSAMEAAWKYLVINSVGLLLGFFGTLLLMYPASKAGAGLVSWHTLLAGASGMDPFIAKMAFIFIIIGYGTKVGLVPMHTWLPDAHGKAPVPVSSLLSGVLLNVALLAILRFKVVVDAAVGQSFSRELLIFFGALSIVVASFIILTQKNYKRLLAYSSIEHMGIATLGFGFGGAGTFAAILHMIYHSLTKSILFLSSGNIFLKYSSTKIAKVKGALKALPITGILFIIGFLSITGIPPFGIFFTEFSILAAGIKNYPMIVILVLVAMVVAFIGFLESVVGMMFGESSEEIAVEKEKTMSSTIAPIIILVAILMVISVFVPPALKTLITSASLTY
ncbi:MAG TPA: proton-conducting transporter membrane subunit [Candidatus Paceibacterota bacterium]|nr:proton-conducting transporter membrane subunit [Candidatus Paceibacterota bacterium]